MAFAILFVIAFFVSLFTYLATNKWFYASLVCIGLFVFNTIIDADHYDNVIYTLTLGLPVVFFASLLGPYVVELRRGIEFDQPVEDNQQENTERLDDKN